jgi:hypothetical protein
MRPILILTVTAALLLPGAAFAFDADTSSAKNPDGSARFSDPDEARALPGLQAYGINSDTAQSSSVYIPQSPASSDLPSLLYSSPAFRTR